MYLTKGNCKTLQLDSKHSAKENQKFLNLEAWVTKTQLLLHGMDFVQQSFFFKAKF